MVTQGKAARSVRGRFTSHKSTTTTPTKLPPSGVSLTSFQSLATPDQHAESHEGSLILTPLQPGDANLSAGRPPSKLVVKEPYGIVQQTINGVDTDLKIATGEHLSVADASLLGLKATQQVTLESSNQPKEKRVLRSQDGASRTRSDLAHFFPDYEEVVFGQPKEPGTLVIILEV